jgi:hypothetical protein
MKIAGSLFPVKIVLLLFLVIAMLFCVIRIYSQENNTDQPNLPDTDNPCEKLKGMADSPAVSRMMRAGAGINGLLSGMLVMMLFSSAIG